MAVTAPARASLAPESRSARRWIREHQLLAFFGVTYLLMFGITFAYVYGLPAPYPVVWFLGIFSPTIAGLLISMLSGGRPAVKAMLVGFTRWRVGLRWYLAALSLVLVPLGIALVYIALGNAPRGLLPGVTAWALVGQFVFTLFSGPLAEEAGWRGFALPRLEAKHSALAASLILGSLWAAWHIPLYFQGGSAAPGVPFPIYLVMVVVLATLFTWLYNNTGGSLVITVLAHFSFNLTTVFITGAFGLLPMNVFFMTAGPALGLMVIAVVAYFGPRHLSRKRAEQLPFQKAEHGGLSWTS
jgi:CAAX protease family protein